MEAQWVKMPHAALLSAVAALIKACMAWTRSQAKGLQNKVGYAPSCGFDLTHCRMETPKRAIGKQCRPRSDAQNAGSDQDLHCLKMVWPFSLEMSKSHSLIYLKQNCGSSNLFWISTVSH